MSANKNIKRITERELAQARAKGYSDRKKQEDPKCPYLLPQLRNAWLDGRRAADYACYYEEWKHGQNADCSQSRDT